MCLLKMVDVFLLFDGCMVDISHLMAETKDPDSISILVLQLLSFRHFVHCLATPHAHSVRSKAVRRYS